MLIHGELGSGKTAISKKAAKRLKERGLIDDIIIEDFEGVKKKISKFEQKMRRYLPSIDLAYA
jgi:hypothetical protein